MASGKFNPAKSDYNKDENFGKITLGDTTKISLSEAVAMDGDKSVTVFGMLSPDTTGLEAIGDPKWKPIETPVKFTIPKATYTSTYNGKETTYTQTPGMAVFIEYINTVGFNTPFKVMCDCGMMPEVAENLRTGKDSAGNPLPADNLKMLERFFFQFEKLEALDKLKDLPMSVQGGKGGYAKGQTEADKLRDRIAFIKGDGVALLTELGHDEAAIKTFQTIWIEKLLG